MTPEERIGRLEAQVADLTARLEQYYREASAALMVAATASAPPPAPHPARRPANPHLRAVK